MHVISFHKKNEITAYGFLLLLNVPHYGFNAEESV